jgi:hypothetical protein
VLEAWILMGGELRWEALEPIAALLGFEDLELLILGLHDLRAHFRAKANAEADHRHRSAPR